MTFAKLTANLLSETASAQLINAELERIISLTGPMQVFLFGSASRNQMTDASDLDFLIVLPTNANFREVKRRYHTSKHARTIPVDAIFVTQDQFQARSLIGGICMICLDEGKLVYEAERQAS